MVTNSVSLLDLVIEGGSPLQLVHSMVVYELNQYQPGSDYSCLIVSLNVGAKVINAPVSGDLCA